MPYGLIVLFASIGATALFVFTSEASTRAKVVVSAILLLTLAQPYLASDWWLAALIGQAVLVIGLVLYSTYQSARH